MSAGIERAELRVAIQRALVAELGDTYDCTRVWEAWGYGTMDEDDFVPVLDRLDGLIDTIERETPGFAAGVEAAAKVADDFAQMVQSIPPQLDPVLSNAEGWRRVVDAANDIAEHIRNLSPAPPADLCADIAQKSGEQIAENANCSDGLVGRVADAIEAAKCPHREGPFGGYDYGHNEAFYGPAPEGGRYVIRDFRDPQKDWGKFLHLTNDNAAHEAMFAKMTREHIAQAAIAALTNAAAKHPD